MHLRHAQYNIAPLGRWVLIGLVILSILSTQWLGLVHQIGHQEFKPSATLHTHKSHASCENHDHSLFAFLGHEKSSVECQLFDALTLAGLIASSPIQFIFTNPLSQGFVGFSIQSNSSGSQQPYQSRAPPLLIL